MRRSTIALSMAAAMLFCQPVGAVPVTDGLVLWLDATDPATVFQDDNLTIPSGPGDPVGGWMDKSGQNFHATMSDEFIQPTYETDVMNGQAAVRFDGLDGDGMIIDPALYLERPYTVFIVNQYHGDIRGRTLQGFDFNWLHGLWAGNFGSYADGWIANQTATQDFVYVEDTTGDLDGSTLFVNGQNVGTNSTPVGIPGTLGIASQGMFPAEVSDADVSEIVIYDRVLDQAELTTVRDHFYTKYNTDELPDPSENQNRVIAGSLGTFTGFGQGVDFEGDFTHAINVGGPGDFSVGDADFTDGTTALWDSDGAEMFSTHEILNWHIPTYDGDTEDNENLELVMESIRWSQAPSELEIELDVAAGTPYKLQLLFAENCCDRGFDVTVEDEIVVDNLNVQLAQEGINNSNQGVVYSLNITPSDGTLNIILGPVDEFAPDNNAILNGITLEANPGSVLAGDFNGNGVLDAEDIDILSGEVLTGDNKAAFDLNNDALVDQKDRTVWVEELKYTYFGDSNLDGEFSSADFVLVFTAGKYEDGEAMNAGWAEGDWNGDKDFDSSDFVTAFQGGGFEMGQRPPMANAVPEPGSAVLVLLGLVGLVMRRRR